MRQTSYEERTPNIRRIVEGILEARGRCPDEEATLVAISGIDGSGKGHTTGLVLDAVRAEGLTAVVVNLDRWFNLEWERPLGASPEGFYRHALRIDELFASLLLPLKRMRSVRVEARVVAPGASQYHQQVFEHYDVDVVLVEGIFLLAPRYRAAYDAAFWLDCSFETAMIRAIRRRQEGLPPSETIRAYSSLYFPAQLIHLVLDDPRSMADAIIANDPRVAVGAVATYSA